MFEELLKLNEVHLNLDSGGGVLLMNIIIGFMMFSVALDLKWEHFKNLIQSPKIMLVGLVSQFVMLPLLTFLIILIFGSILTPAVAFGMILVAACPGGNLSNFLTGFSKSNVALGVGLTAIGTVFSVVMTPLNFKLYGFLYEIILPLFHPSVSATVYNQPLEIPFFDVLRTVFMILGLPVVGGMLVSNFLPKATAKIKKYFTMVSGIVFILFIIAVFYKNLSLLQYIKLIFIIVFFHNLFVWMSAYFFSKNFKLGKINNRTIAIETAIQNSGLGLALILNPRIFPESEALGGMVLVVAWWGIWHFVAGGIMALIWRMRK